MALHSCISLEIADHRGSGSEPTVGCGYVIARYPVATAAPVRDVAVDYCLPGNPGRGIRVRFRDHFGLVSCVNERTATRAPQYGHTQAASRCYRNCPAPGYGINTRCSGDPLL